MPQFSTHLDHGPMSEADLDRLAQLLERYGDPDTGLTLEGVDGLLSAVVVGPGAPILPSEYLPEIFDCEPQYETQQDAVDTLRLLMGLNNHIVWRLENAGRGDELDQQPILMLPVDDDDQPMDPLPDDFPLGAAWALGFMRAVQLRGDDWQAWCEGDEDLADDFSRIIDLTLVLPEQLEEFGIDAEVGLPELADREEIVDDLGDILIYMNHQRQAGLRPSPVRVAAAVGRNDACPCGSGRKYKKCCGDPARSLN